MSDSVLRLFTLVAVICVGCQSTPDGRDGGAGMAGQAGGTSDSGVCRYNPLVSPTNCPTDAPTMCAGPAPSYSGSVAPTIATHCQPCHGAGGMAADVSFDSYAKFYAERRTALDLVTRCIMPPSCASQPTAAQRTALLQWLVCGAPDN